MRRRSWAALALAAAVACGAEPAALTVGDVAFGEEELLGLTEARRLELATLTAFGLATARGEALEVVEPLLERAREDALLTHAGAELALRDGGVDDEQLRAHYLANPAVELTVRHVLFFSERWRPEAHRAQALSKAEAALRRLEAGDSFPEIAAELSEEPGAEGRQGLLTPGREGSWVPEFWNAALRLDVGETSPPVETQYGYHVLRLERRAIVPFEEARPSVVLEVAGLMGSLDESRERASAEGARGLGVVVPEAELAAIRREWEDRVLRWSTALGFAPDLAPARVKEAARTALGSTSQSAAIARTELAELRSLFEASYPIDLAPGS